MRAADFIFENDEPFRIKLGGAEAAAKARAWIERVYAQYPQTMQNNHVMTWGSGDDLQFAMFELTPSFSKRGAVEVKWFQAYPLRQGVGSRAMKELQALAREDGISLTLFPWDKGQVSQSKLTKFYRGQGFVPSVKGGKAMAWTPDQPGVAEGSEQISEYRDRLLQYVKSLLPNYPEYVLKDWLVPNKGNFSNLPDTELKNGIMEKLKGAGLTPNTKWQLVPNMQFTMDMFEPMSKQRLIGRAGGNSDMGLDVPRDKERHATQAALAQQQGGVRKEPVLLIKTDKGYELLEGWHRTIQHFAKYPDGYTGPAYVAVAQQSLAESLRVDVPNEEWLNDAIAYAKQKSPTHYGLPYMGKTTATVRQVEVPLMLLRQIPGMRREQQNVRYDDLAAIMKIMKDTGKLPIHSHSNEEYKPFINVAYDGSAWVNEGNHRIMAAYRLGWDSLPVEISYFDGGERVESGPMYPGKIGL